MSLTERQSAFVREYAVDLNGTQAAIRAGYSEATAESQASRLLRNGKVRAAIDAALKQRAERVEVRADDVLRELLRIAMADVRQLYDSDGKLLPPHKWPDDVAAAVAGMDVVELPGDEAAVVKKVKRWDKVRALELLGKHSRMFAERVEHDGGVRLVLHDPFAAPRAPEEQPDGEEDGDA